MGGVAGEKDPTGPVLRHLAFVAVKPGGPPRVMHPDVGAQRPPHGGPQLIEVHWGVVGQLVMPVPGDHAVPTEKLFAAAAAFDLRVPDLDALPVDQLGAMLVAHFLKRWESDDTLMALLRAAVTNEAAAERAREIFATQVAPALRTVVPDPAEAAVRSGLVASQILGAALIRYVLRLPPVAGMDRAELVAWLGPTVQRYLTERP
jgi:hypothetical protein